MLCEQAHAMWYEGPQSVGTKYAKRVGDTTKLQEMLKAHTLLPGVLNKLIVDYLPTPRPTRYELKRILLLGYNATSNVRHFDERVPVSAYDCSFFLHKFTCPFMANDQQFL